MDFNLPNNIEQIRVKTRKFVDKNIIPLETQSSSYDNHENINEDLLVEIRNEVKKKGYGHLKCQFLDLVLDLVL